jgi:hypothetical protein
MLSVLVLNVWLLVGFFNWVFVPDAFAEKWKLGWGGYGVGGEHAKLERMRWDWIMICHGGAEVEESNRAINEALKHNPDQKYLVRLWPIGGLGRFREHGGVATFLEYHFEPKVRARVREAIKSEVNAVLNGIDKPENILGFTFLEELSGHWAQSIREREVGVDIRHYAAQIAGEMGQDTFEWNARTKKHVCGIYANTLKDIYSYIKSLAPDRKVFHWQHCGIWTTDRSEPVDDPMQPGYLLHKLSDVIGPGGADGLFTYPRIEGEWEQYMQLVRKHNWPFFSQLSHPRGMRITGWKECEQMAMTQDPLNWGSFFFCMGHCLGHRSGDDPSIPIDRDGGRQKEFAGYMDVAVHQRIFQNRHRVGIDTLLSYLRPKVLVHAPLSQLKEKGRAPLTVFVHNPRDIEFWPEYLKEAQTMRDVSVTLDVPASVRVERVGGSRGNSVAPGAYERYDSVLSGRRVKLPLSQAIAIKVECSKSPAAVAEISDETFIPRFQTHWLEYAEEKWVEPGFRMKKAATPEITIRPLIPVIEGPSVRIDGTTITYDGAVKQGQQLVMLPDGRANINPSNMISPMNEGLRDKDSPTGFREFKDGYGVASYTANLPLEGGKEYLLEFEGMATGGANSQVGLRFSGHFEKDFHVDKRYRLWIGLHNRLTDKWSKVSHTFTLPEGGAGLYTLYFYRHHKKGAISYGNFSLTPVGESRDVSGMVRGQMPVLQPGRLNHVTYRDATGERHMPKVDIRIAAEP